MGARALRSTWEDGEYLPTITTAVSPPAPGRPPYSTATQKTGPRDSRTQGEKRSENPRLPAVVKQDAEDGAFSRSIVRDRNAVQKRRAKPSRSKEEV